ncbi:hypothetical protein BDV93DRAFT_611003 [Ceratobasidium sp. AG-I]|nr:hypothetical protein BDV93DRAFT_611003 [Ceratobasidium sp. AG-I]
MSSPVSISRVESISDVNSAISIGEDSPLVRNILGSSGNGLFDLGDGDIRLVINGTTLEAHKFIIKRFSGLKSRIQNNNMELESDRIESEDFRNTFKILYASVVEGPFSFDQSTLTSALRVATLYDYPALRTLAVDRLAKTPLSAVERIRLAREFDLPLWEGPAYVELCNREEAITKEEASVLGLDALVHVARIREKEQRRRGRDVDAATQGSSGLAATAKANQDRRRKRKAKKAAPASPDPDSGSDEGEEVQPGEAVTGTEEKATEPIPVPSFVGTETQPGYWRPQSWKDFVLYVPGCGCAPEKSQGSCTLSPCVARAFKHIQTQQIAHDTSVSKLETTMEQVQATLTPLTTAPEPHIQLDLNQPDRTGNVQEEVRKWLTGVENPTEIAQGSWMYGLPLSESKATAFVL